MALSATYKAKLREFEGTANHMYLDTAGYVTIGVGHALFTANDAVNLPYAFQIYRFRADPAATRSPLSPGSLALGELQLSSFSYSPLPTPSLGIHIDIATPDQVRSDWNAVHTKASGHSFTWYRQYTNCWLSDGDVNALFESDLALYWASLKALYPAIESFPQGAQDALFDLLYNSNLAADGKWPNLKDSVANADWAKAADQCHRGQVQAERNAYTRQCFLDAATAAVQSYARAADESDYQSIGHQRIHTTPPRR
jgi:GH24 family phage-related lysozyme (muramidase)